MCCTPVQKSGTSTLKINQCMPTLSPNLDEDPSPSNATFPFTCAAPTQNFHWALASALLMTAMEAYTLYHGERREGKRPAEGEDVLLRRHLMFPPVYASDPSNPGRLSVCTRRPGDDTVYLRRQRCTVFLPYGVPGLSHAVYLFLAYIVPFVCRALSASSAWETFLFQWHFFWHCYAKILFLLFSRISCEFFYTNVLCMFIGKYQILSQSMMFWLLEFSEPLFAHTFLIGQAAAARVLENACASTRLPKEVASLFSAKKN